MKMLRKITIFLCIFILCLAACGLLGGTQTISAGTKSDENVTGQSGVTYSFNSKSGVLTISGTGDMPANMQFCDDKKIKKVVVKEGVTSVCDYAFLGCTKLKTLSLPDGLLSIGVKSFANTNIKKLVIPASVRRIGQCAFHSCKRLKWITMPGDFEFFYEEHEPDEWEFRIVSASAFSGYAPKKVTFTTPLKLENVAALSAKYLVVSDDDPLYSSVNGAIYSKDGKELLRIPSERTTFRVPDGVEKIYVSAFHYGWYLSDEEEQFCCAKLKKLYLPKGKCKIVEKMYDGESYNLDEQDLQVIAKGTDLTGRDIELLTKYCFNPYTQEAKKEPLKWFNTGFKGLVKLLDNGCMVTNDGLVLRYFGEGGDVKLDSQIKGLGYNSFNYFAVPRVYDPDLPGGITSINIPDSVTYIGSYAFYDQNALESLVIPASVTEFGEEAAAYSGLKKIVFEEGIEEIPQAVCTNCGNLETVVLPKSLKKIGDSAFSYCISFDIDEYSGFEALPNLTEIGSTAFYNCKMKKFVIPEQITKIGHGAFCLNGDFGRDPEEAEIIVMGDAEGYEIGFCSGQAIPVFAKGLSQVKLGIRIWTYYDEPNKAGMMMIGSRWQAVGGIDGYEYEAAVKEDFSDSVKIETTETQGKVFVNAGKSKVTNLYARVRAYKVGDKGKREYSEWSVLNHNMEE